MEAALEYFKDNPNAHFATPALVSYLAREGLLEEPVNEQNFRKHFKEWLDSQGMTLRVGCRQLIFEITPERAAARLQWVREHLPLVDSPEKLEDIIIVDEVTFEEGTHAKGKGPSMYPRAHVELCAQLPSLPNLDSRTCKGYITWGPATSLLPAGFHACKYAHGQLCFAGQKVYQPYMWIKEVQKPMEKKRTSKHKDMVGRRKHLVMVFIRLRYKPLSFICTGSYYIGMPPLKAYYYPTGKKQQYVDLNQFEYQDHIKAALPQLTSKDPLRAGLRGSGELVLLHDEERAHMARSVAKFAQEQRPRRLRLVELPVESPDLTPHDSGFFAEVKRKWHTAVDGSGMAWEEQCHLALQLISSTNPEPYIKEIPLRWRACLEEKGQHIEQRLKQLKGQQ